LYPNPINKGGTLNIKNELITNAEVIEILNFYGKVIKSISASEYSITLDNSFDAGVYFIRIKQGDVIETIKFVIE